MSKKTSPQNKAEKVNLKHKNEIAQDADNEKDFLNDWEKGSPAEIDIDLGLTNVLSVRILKRTHAELIVAAKKSGIAPATFARQAIEEKIAMSESSSATQLAQVMARLVKKIESLQGDPGAA